MTTVSGTIHSDGLTLNDIGPDDKIVGSVNIEKKDFKLLANGIDNKVSALQASEADKVRDCLAPVRQQVLYAAAYSTSGEISILSPFENEIMRTLAQQRGYFGKIGDAVTTDAILKMTQY